MAEAATDNGSYLFLCPFCEVSLNEQDFKVHIEQVHEIFKDAPVDELTSMTKYIKARCSARKEHYEGLFLTEKMKILKGVLKENFPTYLENFKLWIQCEITRGQFDHEVGDYFNQDTIVAHNEFLIDFMKEIRSITKVSELALMNAHVGETSPSYQKFPVSVFQQFPVSVMPYEVECCLEEETHLSCAMPEISSSTQVAFEKKMIRASVQNAEALGSSKDTISTDPMYISLKRTLPDFETIYSMVTASAWETDQLSTNKAAVKLIHNVAEAIVRNILRTIMLRRKNVTVSKDGFFWDTNVTNEKTSEEILKTYTGEVTLQELLDCLVAHPKLIPIKAVYNFTIRRILNMIKKKSKTVSEENNETA